MIVDCTVPDTPMRAGHQLRATALAYAERGWSILPINGITNGACDCGYEHPDSHNGTHPCSYFTHLTASCDPAIIIGWFDKWPNMNFAVAPGRAQDGAKHVMVIVEVSATHDHGAQAMAQFAEMVGSFQICGQVLTPLGKRQIYVEVDAEHDLDFGKIDGAKIYAKDCHVIGAGSLHQSGANYQWEGEPLPTASASFAVATSVTASVVPVAAVAAVDVVNQHQPGANQGSMGGVDEAVPTDFQAIVQATTIRMAVNRAIAAEYMAVGFKLCRITIGSKGPKYNDWPNKPISIDQVNHEGLGLIHALSGTCAIDLDNFESAMAWFEASDIDLRALLDADDAVQIKSGRPNRGKLLYRLPAGVSPLELTQVKHPDGTMVVEFRSASAKGCQDVLPPTIHPDTGKPYEWAGAGDFKNLPELPTKVLALWQSLLATKAAMKPSPTPVATPADQTIPEGGRNNALYKLAGNMARAGCSPESIRAALLIENRDRCQPPLPDHEVESIAKSAATNSYGAKEAAARASNADVIDAESLALAEKAVAEADETASVIETTAQPELIGVMRDIAEWSARTARTVQPAFDLCTALAACSSVLARDFIGGDGSHTNVYSVAVGPSGCGKENTLRTVGKIIDAYAPDRRAGKPASDASVLTVMGRNPASVFILDELGEILQSVFDPKASSYQARIGTVLMDLYTKGGETYRGTEYAVQDSKKINGRERTDLFSPCPSIFGATTAVALFKNMSEDVIGTGFLPRLLYFRAPDAIPLPNFDIEYEPMPESLKGWLAAIKDRVEQHAQAIKERGDLIGVNDHQYQPIKMPYSATAGQLVRKAQVDMVNRRNASVDELESTMLTRIVENASRVALTLALADNPWAVEIEVKHFEAALAIVTNCTKAFLADIRSHMFGSKHSKIETMAFKQIIKFFKEQGRPISERILVDRCATYRAASPMERAQTIKALETQGKIAKKAGRKTNSVIYLPST